MVLLAAFSFFSFTNAQTKIIAHRGFWNTNPVTSENSIQSLKNAQKLGVYGTEFDVRMTKDGVLVVNHDEKINKKEISETSYADLKNEKLSNGEHLPTLEDYLAQGKNSKKVKLIIEIKPAKTPDLEMTLVEKTLEAVKKFKLTKQVEFISFSLAICKEIKKTDQKAMVQYLNGELSPEEVKAIGLDGIDYHYSVFLEKHPDWISQAKELGIKTNTWTVNDTETFKKLQDMGVDFVTTNTPDVFLKQ